MDNLSLLQERVDLQCQSFFNHLGVLQRDAPPAVNLDGRGAPSAVVDASEAADAQRNFAKSAAEYGESVITAAKQIDDIIDSLPGGSLTKEDQYAQLEKLELENKALGSQLVFAFQETENYLDEVRNALQSIYDDSLGVVESSRTQSTYLSSSTDDDPQIDQDLRKDDLPSRIEKTTQPRKKSRRASES